MEKKTITLNFCVSVSLIQTFIPHCTGNKRFKTNMSEDMSEFSLCHLYVSVFTNKQANRLRRRDFCPCASLMYLFVRDVTPTGALKAD